MNEEYRKTRIEGYEISNLGNVRLTQRRVRSGPRHAKQTRIIDKEPKIMYKEINSKGYYTVRLNIEKGKNKHFRIHRLVAEAFIENPQNLPEVNHKNLNKLDNRVENLEWMSGEENIKHYMESDKYKDYLGTLR